MEFYFQKLLAWQKAFEVTKIIYSCTKKFPSDERYALIDQMRRSSISMMSNLAEGSGRTTNNDKNHFYTMAKGSAMELASQLILAQELGYIADGETFETCKKLLGEIAALIYSYMK